MYEDCDRPGLDATGFEMEAAVDPFADSWKAGRIPEAKRTYALPGTDLVPDSFPSDPPRVNAMDGITEDDVVVLHEGSGVIAVRKPAGLATQAPPGIDSMERRVRDWLARRGGHYLGVPHRLDRPVSGILLFAATPRAARQLSRQFERRTIVKRYAALLEPRSQDDLPGDGRWVEWRDRIAKVPDEPKAMLVPEGEPCDAAREAVTRVRLVAFTTDRDRPAIEVEFAPVTGRMHQLRLQAASRDLPVLGDVLYGSTATFRDASPGLSVAAIALHACRIEYIDPDTKANVVISVPPSW